MNEQPSTIKPLFLHRDNPLAWVYMPQVIERIKKFCIKYRLDHNPDELAKLVLWNFVADDPGLLVVLGIESSKVLVHCLAGIDEFMGKKYLTVIQYEKDEGLNLTEYKGIIQAIFDMICGWGVQKGATVVQLLTPDEKRANYFARTFGFVQHRILMRMPIKED